MLAGGAKYLKRGRAKRHPDPQHDADSISPLPPATLDCRRARFGRARGMKIVWPAATPSLTLDSKLNRIPKLSLSSFALVLVAAVLHAAWNGVAKGSDDRLSSTWAIVMASAVIYLVMLGWIGWPQQRVWPLVVVSGLAHTIYTVFLVIAYEHADLSVAYPIARGTAPVVVTAGATLFLGDRASLVGIAGTILVSVSLGILATTRPLRDTRWAIATGVMIAIYTLVDGFGVRTNDNAAQYLAAATLVHALALTGIAIKTRGRAAMAEAVSAHPARLFAAGAASVGAYLLVMIAARTEPLGLVAGLRETSALFALVIGKKALHEKLGLRQIVAVGVSVLGAIFIALG